MERLISNFFDLDFDVNRHASDCNLRVLIGVDGLTIGVSNPDSSTSLLKSWSYEKADSEQAIRRILASEHLLSLNFAQKTLWIFTPEVTLVPKRMFDPENLSQYFSLLTDGGISPTLDAEWPKQHCQVIQQIPHWLSRQLGLYFQGVTPAVQAFRILKIWEIQAQPQDADVFLNLRPGFIQIGVFEQGKLLFFNTFPFSNSNDVLYFTLLAYDQTQLKPGSVPLTISGPLETSSEIYRTLQRFVSYLRLMPIRSVAPNEVAGHWHPETLCPSV